MKIVEFLEKNSINYFPINLEIHVSASGKIKKILRPYSDGSMPSYVELSDHNLINFRKKTFNYLKHIWVDTSKVNQIDVDGDFDPKIDTPYFKSVTKQKPHYFVKGFLGLNKKRTDTKWENVELLCGQGSYCSKDILVINAEKNILDYTGKIDNVLDTSKMKMTIPSKSNISGHITNLLNKNFNLDNISWKSNSYGKRVCIIPNTPQCLCNSSKIHSTTQSFISLSKTTATLKCHSCGEININNKKYKNLINELKQEFDIEMPDKKADYFQIQEYLDEYTKENQILKKNGMMMKKSPECPIEYTPISDFSEFLDDLFRYTDDTLKNVYKRPLNKKNLLEYLHTIHTDIRELKRDNNLVGFYNGYLTLNDLKFHEYSNESNFIGKKFLPFNFNAELLQKDWDEISCPIFDKIVKDQEKISESQETLLVFYGLLGSLHYPNNDSIKVSPYLYGTAGSGKSTVTNIILNTFSPESVGTINCKEKVFGKTAFLSKDVIIDSDTPANMINCFGKTDFQKAVSGEIINIPVKNQKSETQHRVLQRMLFCSQYIQDTVDTGEISRRIAYFEFIPLKCKTESNLEQKCISQELDKVLIKILLARKKLLEKYKNTQFHDWNVPYFQEKFEDNLLENNYLYSFISNCDELIMNSSSRMDFESFQQIYVEYFKQKGQRVKRLKTSDVMFSKIGLNVIKEKKCKSCGKIHSLSNKCCNGWSKTNKSIKYFIDGLEHRFMMNIDDDDTNAVL